MRNGDVYAQRSKRVVMLVDAEARFMAIFRFQRWNFAALHANILALLAIFCRIAPDRA